MRNLEIFWISRIITCSAHKINYTLFTKAIIHWCLTLNIYKWSNIWQCIFILTEVHCKRIFYASSNLFFFLLLFLYIKLFLKLLFCLYSYNNDILNMIYLLTSRFLCLEYSLINFELIIACNCQYVRVVI